MIPEIPGNFDWITVRRRLVEMRNELNKLSGTNIQPRAVVNLSATAKAGGVIIQFTKTDGDSYVLYRNTVPQLNKSVMIDLGNTGIYVDDIGASGEKRYYWIIAKRGSIQSAVAGPVSATTLALDAEITPPTPPPAVDEPVTSLISGYPME
jgi:hypothetical protein